MNRAEIAFRRLRSLCISAPLNGEAGELVSRLGALQAQDFVGARWALGQRLVGARDADIEQAFNRGSILRTHLLRPTWHFVTPADIRWILSLSAARVHAANGTMYRKLDLDQGVFSRCNNALARALAGGRQATRIELRQALERAGVATEGDQRLTYLLMQAELEQVICSGGRRGNQFTYALLDERAPDSPSIERPAALAELAARYFPSRGPATVHDFAKWAGLTVAEGQEGLAAVKDRLEPVLLDGVEFWYAADQAFEPEPPLTAHLLSIYDELISSYRDRSAIADDQDAARLTALGNALRFIVLIDGRVVGTWRRTSARESITIEVSPFRHFSRREWAAVRRAAQRYSEFAGLPVELTLANESGG